MGRLRHAIGLESFAGVTLTGALRGRMMAVVSALAGAGPVDAETLRRFLMPILLGHRTDEENFRIDLAVAVSRLEVMPAKIAAHEAGVGTGRVQGRLRLITLLIPSLFALLQLQSSTPSTGIKVAAPQASAPRPTSQAAGEIQVTGSAIRAPYPLPWDVPLNIAVAVSILLVILALLWRHVARLPLRIDRREGRADVRLRPQPRLTAVDTQFLTRMRRALSTPVRSSPIIDVEASVVATAANGGMPVLRHRLVAAFPHFTVAIERQSRRDAFAAWWTRMMSQIAHLGVPLRLIEYRTPAFATRAIQDRLRRLAGGQAEYPNQRMLILDGPGVAGPVADPALQGESVAVVQLSRLSVDERRSKGGGRGAADLQLLAHLLGPLGHGHEIGVGEPLFGFEQDWFDEMRISDERWQRLRASLLLHLGHDGFRWMAGIAVNPMLDERFAWSVAEALALSIEPDDERARAARLFATPWFRAGWMPRWLRERLMAELSVEDSLSIHRLMIGSIDARPLAERPSADDGPGFTGDVGEDIALDDPMLAHFLLAPRGDRRIMAGLLPRALRRRLVPSIVERLFDRSTLLILFVSAATVATAIIVLPSQMSSVADQASEIKTAMPPAEKPAADLNAYPLEFSVISGEIGDHSFYDSAVEAGLDERLISQFTDALSYDFDWQQEVGVGSIFEAGYELHIRNGKPFGNPNLVYVYLKTKKKVRQLYKFSPKGSSTASWFDANGQNIGRLLMRTPVDGSRINPSSEYPQRSPHFYDVNSMAYDFHVGTVYC